MRIQLLRLEKGFLEDLGDSADFTLVIERWNMDRWLEDREAEDRLSKKVTIMPLVNFEQLIQLPLGKTPSGATMMDRQKNFTDEMMKLYTVGAAHTECSHVMFTK